MTLEEWRQRAHAAEAALKALRPTDLPLEEQGRRAYARIVQLEAAGRRVLDAYERCDSNRGWFSAVDQHDLRCGRRRLPEPCECGADDLRGALEALEELSPPKPTG